MLTRLLPSRASATRAGVFCILWLCVARAVAAETAIPRFADSAAERRKKIEAIAPQIAAFFQTQAAEKNLPGVVHGIVLDGELLHATAFGVADVEAKRPVALDTRFRVASMTKSFTAMAILKLRNENHLRIGDHVAKYLPEYASVRPLTSDAPPLRIDHLMTMLAGFPTDDPWGDRQLAVPPDELRDFVRGGLSFSTASGTNYEYSNLAYALLGQIITNVSGESYQDYITEHILAPLGMKDTVWEIDAVPPEKLALGYRWEDGKWLREPMLHDGTFGAMGGLVTTLPDFARYVAFHLGAWPARDGDNDGPVPRATVREMHFPHGPVRLLIDAKDANGATLPATALGYSYGLISSRDATGVFAVRHSGGLPGFGSNYTFLPELGVAVISFANRTYAPMNAINQHVIRQLVDTAKLTPRTLPASAQLERSRQQVMALLRDNTWDAAAFDALAANNLALDQTRERRATEARRLFAQLGKITATEPLVAENQLRGTFAYVGENGRLDVTLQLSPEAEPKVQTLELRFTAKK